MGWILVLVKDLDCCFLTCPGQFTLAMLAGCDNTTHLQDSCKAIRTSFLYNINCKSHRKMSTHSIKKSSTITEVEGDLFDAPDGSALIRELGPLLPRIEDVLTKLTRRLQLQWILGRRYCEEIQRQSS